MKFLMMWRDRLPIVKWLPRYSFHSLQCDFIAGITVGLMVIPQGLAYAVIAGLPAQYGLYSAYMCCFVYCLLGTSKDISLGPTAVMSLLVADYADKCDIIDISVALSFFCGIIWLIMGMLSLGFIVRLIPLPVISGFTSSAAIIIACGQLKNFLGLPNVPRTFFPGWGKLISRISSTKVGDLVLGLICVILLQLLRRLNKIEWPPQSESPSTLCQRISRKVIWFVGTGRNGVILIASALVAKAFESRNVQPFSLTGEVAEGFPRFGVPNLKCKVQNTTISTFEMMSEIGLGFVTIPLIGFLVNIAIAQAFVRGNQHPIDPKQELIALGFVNFLGSFVSSYPVIGSFSRTAINAVSGVATPFAGVFTGCVVLVALKLLTSSLRYIPEASLAAVVMVSVLQMVDVRIIKKIWLTNRIDVVPLVVTFFACLVKIDVGILSGIVAALIIVLYRHLVPRIDIQGREVCHVGINGGLTYMGIEHFVSQVRQNAFLSKVKPEVVIIECASMPESDFTVMQGFSQIVQDCKDNDIDVMLSNVQNNVKQMLVNGGLPLEPFKDYLDEEHDNLLSPKTSEN